MRTKHKIGDIRRCLYFNECGRQEVYNGRFKEIRRKFNGGWVCNKHICKLDPKRTKEYKKIYNDRRIRFLGKRFVLSFNLRTGICSICGLFGKKTDMHHYFYVPIMIWACTEERCGACHSIETMKYVRENGLTNGWKKRRMINLQTEVFPNHHVTFL